MANIRAYAQMVDEARTKGWPIEYGTDLYAIDRAIMESDDAPVKFGWILRNYGTHLFRSRRDEGSIDFWIVGDGMSDPAVQAYWYDGDFLKRVTMAKLAELVRTLGDGPDSLWPVNTALTNRIEQLRIQEANRMGKSLQGFELAYRDSNGEVQFSHHDFPYIERITRWQE